MSQSLLRWMWGTAFSSMLHLYLLQLSPSQVMCRGTLQIPNHPLHPEHSDKGFFLRQRPFPYDNLVYGCALCKEKRNMFFYECYSCYFFLDIKCAHLSSSYKFNQPSKYDIRKHPLTFIESHMAIDVLKNFNCL
ncbi:hypothetical protein ERO13_A06G169302v2 [Gossypium hirsutum]|nr:hypothetical protein ERO13_A06G169302v2 [Gossypium hirsutum]